MLDVPWFTEIIKKLRLTNQLHSRLELEHVTLKKNIRKIATQTASINGCFHDDKMRFKLIEFTARHGGTKIKLIQFLPHYPVSGLDPLLLQCGPRLGVVALGWGDGTGHGVMPAGVGWPWAHGVALGCWRPSCHMASMPYGPGTPFLGLARCKNTCLLWMCIVGGCICIVYVFPRFNRDMCVGLSWNLFLVDWGRF